MKCNPAPFPVSMKYYQGMAILRLSKYMSNGRIAAVLIDPQTYEPIAKVSANIEGVELLQNEICLKDYSENEGCLDSLLDEGVVELTGRYAQSGHCDFPIVRFTPKALNP